MMLDPVIQRANRRIERIFAHVRESRVEGLGQFNERRIARVEIERPVSNSDHPAVKAALARSPSEPRRQMKGLPADRPVGASAVSVRMPAHQGNLGKRRGKQVAADACQSPAIPEDEEMIDKRAMMVDRPQFGINCQIGLFGLAVTAPHPIQPRIENSFI
jgi:hypothetical protein